MHEITDTVIVDVDMMKHLLSVSCQSQLVCSQNIICLSDDAYWYIQQAALVMPFDMPMTLA